MTPKLLVVPGWDDFELLDTGDGRKWERYGPYRLIRPEPQAIWRPAQTTWAADGEFLSAQTAADDDDVGRWKVSPNIPDAWPLARGDIRFWASCTPFRHLAFFPDQATQWDWMAEQIARGQGDVEILNLFGYTGVASLVAAHAGARVTHVDASRKAISAAVENQNLSGLAERPIRWLVDDALKFVEREVRRGRSYQGIILDPPKFGRGPKGEVWKLMDQLPALLEGCRALLTDRPLFLILTVYAIRMSALALQNALADRLADLGGTLEFGDMALYDGAGRALPTAIFARWSAAR
jgi:23S rRNA (cytosine1962-C5)-methyltransferase